MPFPRTELRLRTDAVLDALDRLHETWVAGEIPRASELVDVADDLADLCALVAFSSVIDAFHAPAFAPSV